MRAGTTDIGVLNEVFIHDVYASALEGVEPGDVVCDVGANFGAFTVAAAMGGTRVIAIEPLPGNVAALRRNLELNRLTDSVEVIEAAVTGSSGVATLHYTDRDTSAATLRGELRAHWDGSEPVRAVPVRALSLADVYAQARISHCALLKMDCEGSEREILLNVPEAALRATRSVVTEVHDPRDLDPILDRLQSAGFTTTVAAENNVVLARRSLP
jgi:FkbM family methyltransferase